MDPDKLRRERAEVLEEAEAIVRKAEEEDRGLTDDERSEVDSKLTEADKREKDIERIEALEQRRMEKVVDTVKEAGEGDGGFRSLGDFVRAVLTNPHDPRLRQASDMELGDQPAALVPEAYAKEILQVSTQASVVKPRATVIPADASQPDGAINIPMVDYTEGMYGGVEVTWIDEGKTKPKTDLTFDGLKLTPKEVAAHVVVTDKLLRNAPAIEVVLNQMLAKALAAAIDDSFMNDVGSPTPILGHEGTVVVARDTAGEISYTDLCSIYSQFLGESGVWVCAVTALPSLMQMEDTAGHLIWQANAAVSPTGTVLGDPLLKSQRQPTLGEEGDIGLYDFSQYIVKEGYGLFIGKSEHVYYTTNKTVVKIFELIDGSPWMSGPLTLEDDTTEASPFVVLGDTAS
jgi:HK97 family phage major capsid protein